MRYAVISDVHANLEALNAVLHRLGKETFDDLLFLGDSVGYGPNPNDCIEILKEKAKILLAGNHDWASVGKTDIEYFNPYARAAIEWTKKVLTEKNKAFIKNLPISKSLKIEYDENNPPRLPLAKGGKGGFSGDDILLVHATPKEPEQWNYLLTSWDADINFHFFKERLCFIGHSHDPAIIELPPKNKIIVYKNRADIKEGHRYIINAGSIGQPRDGNPDAAYVLFNENSVEIKRVSYDIVSTQKKMREAGLPSSLIERLSKGI